ncbi:hypothetical protein D3C71_1944310 [compost metagenome]
MLEAIPISAIRRFDFLLGIHITQAINQVHAANAIYEREHGTSTFEISINLAVAAIKAYLERVVRAEQYVEQIGARQR